MLHQLMPDTVLTRESWKKETLTKPTELRCSERKKMVVNIACMWWVSLSLIGFTFPLPFLHLSVLNTLFSLSPFFCLSLPLQMLLEEKQRARRRKREALQAEATEQAAAGNHEAAARLEREASCLPTWFKKEYDPISNTMMHVYKGGYWEAKLRQDWGDLPNVFET